VSTFSYTLPKRLTALCRTELCCKRRPFQHGRSLEEQRDFLKTRLALFKKLFPNLKLDWSTIQLYDGQPLSGSTTYLQKRNYCKYLARHSQQKTMTPQAIPKVK